MEESNKASKSKIYILDLGINSDKEKNKKENPPWAKRVERCNFCGSQIQLVNKARHEKSAKHRDGVYLTSERFEII
jgi:hypothetical protein